eukprot:3857566-Rhodomonas_salina.1
MANQIQESLNDEPSAAVAKKTFPWDENPWTETKLVEIVMELPKERGMIQWANVREKFAEATCNVFEPTDITKALVQGRWNKLKASTRAAAASGSEHGKRNFEGAAEEGSKKRKCSASTSAAQNTTPSTPAASKEHEVWSSEDEVWFQKTFVNRDPPSGDKVLIAFYVNKNESFEVEATYDSADAMP